MLVDLREVGEDDDLELYDDDDLAHEFAFNHLYPALAYKGSLKGNAANKERQPIETSKQLSKLDDKSVYPGLFYQHNAPAAKLDINDLPCQEDASLNTSISMRRKRLEELLTKQGLWGKFKSSAAHTTLKGASQL